MSVTKHLLVYGRYFCNGDVKTSFLGILELQNGLAVTITEALCKLCSDLKVDLQTQLCGLGSDGAAVMLGNRGGVSKLLREKAPFLVANRCIAHRLALACGQTANEILYLKEFKDILNQLYQFYQHLPVRTAGLKSIQDLLDDPLLKLSEAKDVRWLSHEKAVDHLHKCLKSVVTSLEREAEE